MGFWTPAFCPVVSLLEYPINYWGLIRPNYTVFPDELSGFLKIPVFPWHSEVNISDESQPKLPFLFNFYLTYAVAAAASLCLSLFSPSPPPPHLHPPLYC